jgi:hypothetical protein
MEETGILENPTFTRECYLSLNQVCLTALSFETDFPDSVRGPVLSRLFRRFASSLASEIAM